MVRPTQRGSFLKWTTWSGLLATLSVAYYSFAQDAPPSIAPLQGSWATIDERFVFLTVELSSVEASMNAVNSALVAAGRDQSTAQQRAENYAGGNSRMDRQGGSPMNWQDFYGKTATSFYYHSSGSIHAQGQSNFQLDARYQGKDTKAIERPPQFDYIYRANSDAQKQAEMDAASLGNKIDQLLARRRELESEQSALWCKIALRGLTSRNLPVKPLYRYDLPASPGDKQSTQRFAAIFAECKFMRTINIMVKQAQPALDGDQTPVFTQLQKAIDSAHEDLAASLLNLPILADALTDPQSYIGQFNAAAQRLDDLSQNLIDAYRLAGDGDRANDDQRKDSFRGQFQQTVMDFASTVLTADEALVAQAAEWNITPDGSHRVTMDPNAKPLIVITALPVPPPSSINSNASAQPLAAQQNNAGNTNAVTAEHDQTAAVVAITSIQLAADDFVINAYCDGQKIPDSDFELEADVFGATAMKISNLTVRPGDWIVFNVVNDRFRWQGAYGFAAAGLTDDETVAFATDVDSGKWCVCESPDQASEFIRDARYLSDKHASVASKPWKGCDEQMKKYCDWSGQVIWGSEKTRNVWIKYIVPAPKSN